MAIGKPLPGVEYPEIYPMDVTLGKATITLNGDGSYDGDGEAFIKEIETVTWPTVGTAPGARTITWLMANAIRNSR